MRMLQLILCRIAVIALSLLVLAIVAASIRPTRSVTGIATYTDPSFSGRYGIDRRIFTRTVWIDPIRMYMYSPLDGWPNATAIPQLESLTAKRPIAPVPLWLSMPELPDSVYLAEVTAIGMGVPLIMYRRDIHRSSLQTLSWCIVLDAFNHQIIIPYNIYWPGVVLNISIVYALGIAIRDISFCLLKYMRERRNLCRNCKYSLNGLTELVCPECGCSHKR